MIRGTTPKYTFNVDVPGKVISDIEVTFKQASSDLEIQKELVRDNLRFVDGVLSLALTQEETASFDVGSCQVQLRVLTDDKQVLASEIARIKVEPSLSVDVLGE